MDILAWRQVLMGFTAAVLFAAGGSAFAGQPSRGKVSGVKAEKPAAGSKRFESATFGNGCFWCTEAVFRELKGVRDVVSGFSGGKLRNPSYKAVLTGTTGHAEVVQITYDPKVISYADLLEVFWKTHDPTTPNRQGADVGTQYRSVIFYHNDEQQELAKHYKKKLDESEAFRAPIVTEISSFTAFYSAEGYHQDFYERNPGNRYCRVVIQSKVKKFRHVFKDKLKTSK